MHPILHGHQEHVQSCVCSAPCSSIIMDYEDSIHSAPDDTKWQSDIQNSPTTWSFWIQSIVYTKTQDNAAILAYFPDYISLHLGRGWYQRGKIPFRTSWIGFLVTLKSPRFDVDNGSLRDGRYDLSATFAEGFRSLRGSDTIMDSYIPQECACMTFYWLLVDEANYFGPKEEVSSDRIIRSCRNKRSRTELGKNISISFTQLGVLCKVLWQDLIHITTGSDL